MSKKITFGQLIAKLRKEKNLQLREVAARVKRENGQPISFQYLSDLEHDRRPAPSDLIIDGLADALEVSRSLLYLNAKRLPPDFDPPLDERRAEAAYSSLCRKANSKTAV